MRILLLALFVLAFPTIAAAQDPAGDREAAPRVQLEQTTDAAPRPGPSLDPVQADAEQNVESRTTAADDAAVVQDPSTRQFWYIVLAVVIGGVILAVLL